MALYGEKLSFKVSLRVGGRVPNYNATSGPQLTAEAEFESVELVSWGQVWQQAGDKLDHTLESIGLIVRLTVKLLVKMTIGLAVKFTFGLTVELIDQLGTHY